MPYGTMQTLASCPLIENFPAAVIWQSAAVPPLLSLDVTRLSNKHD